MSDIAVDIEVSAPIAPARVAVSAPARWQDYLALLKPRVMSLVVFTALTGLICADGKVNPILGAIAILCIAVGAGASGALNMAFDSDIDALMRRTRSRPVPMGKISREDAFFFGGALSLFSVMLMGLAVNYLAAGLLAFTIAFYALVYTVWLKRSTPQNIVIGGLAGALPPVVGWAAATGAAPLDAWLLCGIIFLWTPPHFWALSLYISTDYAKAGVPMLPVVKGAAETRKQILLYSLLLVPIGLAPVFTGLGHWLYGAVATAGGVGFLALAGRLYLSKAGDDASAGPDGLYAAKPDAKPARDLFRFSLIYLFGLYAALLAEHAWPLLLAVRP